MLSSQLMEAVVKDVFPGVKSVRTDELIHGVPGEFHYLTLDLLGSYGTDKGGGWTTVTLQGHYGAAPFQYQATVQIDRCPLPREDLPKGDYPHSVKVDLDPIRHRMNAPLGVFMDTSLGEPHVFDPNMVPAMLLPAESIISKRQASGGLKALQKLNAMYVPGVTVREPMSAAALGRIIDSELDVKIGMLSACNFCVLRYTIHDSDDWRLFIKDMIPEIKGKLGDKIGMLGDQRLVGLDESYQGQATGSTDSYTGKLAVHIARREAYQAWKVTLLALVKA